jgi:hypothetical protein
LTLQDRETKQVEFVRASGVNSERIYVYDGALFDWNRWRGYDANFLRQNDSIGAESNPKVWVMREFKNSKENGLGIPLPKGRLRFYQRDEDGQLEFVGENNIDHTPKDETVRVYVGNAFDIVGERKRTAFKVDNSNNLADESFEIILRNRKKEAVEVRVGTEADALARVGADERINEPRAELDDRRVGLGPRPCGCPRRWCWRRLEGRHG